ncbi:hypothetical protein [Hymenobacter volaticus]|uniref:Uncharacterized protein n=1 Tax=Hymenobacter volaticus TaxID=2932254 RepID=A0ABY4G3Z8_9BACT|nr:hypothetical protein [Hymenobacter volaticus]UOQ65578.1 hypothetical protein MUN86_18855 [Hymenobacter volaticus]
MATLYIFGIGGTGSRVIRSLTMLLAAGVELQNCNRVVPIIIDPDALNGDKQRTIELLKTYQRLRQQLRPAPEAGQFFHTEIATLASMAATSGQERDPRVKETFEYNFSGMDEPLRDYLHYNSLPVETKHLVDLLFDPKSLNEPLTVGFKGSPNVGSVVLNQLMNSPEIEFFANGFGPDDRVFFISSIFGGTGAAGFPLLLKNLRNPKGNLAKKHLLNTAPMGALTVLPYFDLKSDETSSIDSNTFITKTKAALAYYQRNLPDLNSLYYVGDQAQKQQENREGGNQQRNDAHFVELVGALSVLDFMRQSAAVLQNDTHFYEYGLERDDKEVRFESFDPNQTRPLLGPALTRFKFFATWLEHHFPETDDAVYAKNINLKSAWQTAPFFRDLRRFLFDYNSPEGQPISFKSWLRELRDNARHFVPFRLDETDFDKIVQGQEVKKGFFNSDTISRSYVRERLDKQLRKVTEAEAPGEFVRAFSEVMENVVEAKVPGF